MGDNKRLIGVIFIGILAILVGAFVIYMTWGITSANELGWNAISIVLVTFASSFVICGVFLLRLKNWARLFFIIAMSAWFGFGILCVLRNFLFGMIVYTVGLEGLVGLEIFGFIIPSWFVIIYLTRKKVKARFQ